jgi:hypothetical protein
MSLETIIPPEVKNDSFYAHLKTIARRCELKTFLEIGSSSGTGSTQALVEGILGRSNTDAQLFCMELSRTRYLNLTATYNDHGFVFPYNLSSVRIEDFPSRSEVERFYTTTNTNLNKFGLDTVLSWLDCDIKYISQVRLNYCGIQFIKTCNKIETFDFVLIDGSEFTGDAELRYVWGSRVIALDDVNSYKCFSAYLTLAHHRMYKLVAQDLGLRNGYAIFEKIG